MTEWTNAFQKSPDLSNAADALKDKGRQQAERNARATAKKVERKASNAARERIKQSAEALRDNAAAADDAEIDPRQPKARAPEVPQPAEVPIVPAAPADHTRHDDTSRTADGPIAEPRRRSRVLVGSLAAVGLLVAVGAVFFAIRGSDSTANGPVAGVVAELVPASSDTEVESLSQAEELAASVAEPTTNDAFFELEPTAAPTVEPLTASGPQPQDCRFGEVEKWVAGVFTGCLSTEPCADQFTQYSEDPPTRCDFASANDECPVGYVFDPEGADPSCRSENCKYPLLYGEDNYCVQRWRCAADGGSIVDNGRCRGVGRPQGIEALFDLEHVYYAQESATIEASEQNKVSATVLVFEQLHPDAALLVVGHSDPSEDSQIAQERASEFVAALISAGIPRERVKIRSAGSAYPLIDPTTSEADRAQNRRIIFNFEWTRRS